ncbi:hypothetical protein SAMN05216215_10321, partial [Saccharopolyspora shandongensis]
MQGMPAGCADTSATFAGLRNFNEVFPTSVCVAVRVAEPQRLPGLWVPLLMYVQY